jgi:predicted RNA binding protein YcfA (HicA-like mRNA interferase family)
MQGAPRWGATKKMSQQSKYDNITQVKVRDIVKILEKDGWYLVVIEGSHRQYKHRIKKGRVTIAGHPKDELAPGTLNSIFKQAGLKEVRWNASISNCNWKGR